MKCSPAVIVLALSGAILARPAHAGTVTFDISGTLGPVIAGVDPLKFAGQTFTATGSLDQGALPSSMTADSATYNIPGDIQISVGILTLNGFNATLTLTAPPSGPDTMALGFSVTELSFTPNVNAILSLPEGTLTGTGLQSFSVDVTQPDSNLSFIIPYNSNPISGNLGVTGTASMSGASAPPPQPPSGVPEPATIGLLAGGLLTLAIKLRRIRA